MFFPMILKTLQECLSDRSSTCEDIESQSFCLISGIVSENIDIPLTEDFLF